MAYDCVKCFDLRGLAGGQAYLMEKVSKLFPFLLAIFIRYAIVRSCPIHSTSHRRHALARIARVSSSKAGARHTSCTQSMSRACLFISAFITGNAIVAAGHNGSPSRYPTSRLQVLALTWTSSNFTLPNPNQTKPSQR